MSPSLAMWGFLMLGASPSPTGLTLVVRTASGQPIAGARLFAGGARLTTDAQGEAWLPHDPSLAPPVLIKHPGYRLFKSAPGPHAAPRWTISLTPLLVKAAYLSISGIGHEGLRAKILSLVEKTELNSLVIEMKSERGHLSYRSGVPLAVSLQAHRAASIPDLEALLTDLRRRGIYTIARLVVFKDPLLASARPELAVLKASLAGAPRPWLDRDGLAWADPGRLETQRYNIQLAKELALFGFDEIQFDYVRYPDAPRDHVVYAQPNTEAGRIDVIQDFLRRAQHVLGPLPVFVAADLFGYAAWNNNDTGIGHRLEDLAPYLDYLCPMAYPSGYHHGIPNFTMPLDHPYEIVFWTVKRCIERTQQHAARVRPWIQDFRDYHFDKRKITARDVRLQMKGALEAGGQGWMLWNPRNVYTEAALARRPSPPKP